MMKSIEEIRAEFAKVKAAKQADAPAKKSENLNTFLQVPYYTPSDKYDVPNMTPAQKKKAAQKFELQAGSQPISITNIKTRGAFLAGHFAANDFAYDANGYYAWTYTWAYLALTAITYIFIHPLVAIPFAWKVGHNWSQYMGTRIWGKEDMKGKVMYATK